MKLKKTYKQLFDNFKKLTVEEWEEKINQKQKLFLSEQTKNLTLKTLFDKKDIDPENDIFYIYKTE